MIALLLAACSHDVSVTTEVTVPGVLLEDLVYPHRVILALEIPATLNNQLSLGEICTPQAEDLVLTHSIARSGCAMEGVLTAWLEPASTDATCALEPGAFQPLTEPPQGAPTASVVVFEGSEDCADGSAEAWLTVGFDDTASEGE